MFVKVVTRNELRTMMAARKSKYEKLKEIEFGYYEVTQNGLKGVVNGKGEEILKPEFLHVHIVKPNIIAAAKVTGKYHLYSDNGCEVTPREFETFWLAAEYAKYF